MVHRRCEGGGFCCWLTPQEGKGACAPGSVRSEMGCSCRLFWALLARGCAQKRDCSHPKSCHSYLPVLLPHIQRSPGSTHTSPHVGRRMGVQLPTSAATSTCLAQSRLFPCLLPHTGKSQGCARRAEAAVEGAAPTPR